MKKKYMLAAAVTVIGICALAAGIAAKGTAPDFSGYSMDYMNGFSSVDFKGYRVYDGEKLVRTDKEPLFQIENEEDMPIFDGSEMCFPLYNSVAAALYKNIGSIEYACSENHEYQKTNGKIVTFTNSVMGYQRLAEGKADLMFGLGPTFTQQDYAKKNGEEIETYIIGKEAFIFFVEKDNPVESLTSDQLRKIYSGEIDNWKDVGGKDQAIIAFQHPETSETQQMMHSFMSAGNKPLMAPFTFDLPVGKAGTKKEIARYVNTDGAIGYSFRYYLEELGQEKDIKILAVDGIYPEANTIQNNDYPILTAICLSKLSSNDNPYVNRIIDYLLSEDGQTLILKTGYFKP